MVLWLKMVHPSSISFILFKEYIFAVKKGTSISKIVLHEFSLFLRKCLEVKVSHFCLSMSGFFQRRLASLGILVEEF